MIERQGAYQTPVDVLDWNTFSTSEWEVFSSVQWKTFTAYPVVVVSAYVESLSAFVGNE